MSIRTLILLGRGASAVLRDVVRRWCRAVAWRSRLREHVSLEFACRLPAGLGFSLLAASKRSLLGTPRMGRV
jgi:hypothetical protein